MIEELDVNSKYLHKLEEYFTDVFTQDKVKYDMDNNTFTHYYAFIVDDNPVAFINYQIMYERAELIQINVLDEYKQKGIASKLVELMISECMKCKVESITLEVRIDNNPAINLYNKYGFTEIGKRNGYYKGIDGILMERKLI